MRRPRRVQTPASLFAIGCLAISKGVLCVASRRARGRVAVGGAPSKHSARSLVEVGAAVAGPPPAPAAALQAIDFRRLDTAVSSSTVNEFSSFSTPNQRRGGLNRGQVADAVAALRAGTTTVVCSPCALGAAACERASRAVAAAPLHAVGCARGLRCGGGPRGERMTDCRRPHVACSARLGAALSPWQPDR